MNLCFFHIWAYAAWSLPVWHVVVQSNEFPGYISYNEHHTAHPYPSLKKKKKKESTKVYHAENPSEISTSDLNFENNLYKTLNWFLFRSQWKHIAGKPVVLLTTPCTRNLFPISCSTSRINRVLICSYTTALLCLQTLLLLLLLSTVEQVQNTHLHSIQFKHRLNCAEPAGVTSSEPNYSYVCLCTDLLLKRSAETPPLS